MLGMIHPLVGMAEKGWRVLYFILYIIIYKSIQMVLW